MLFFEVKSTLRAEAVAAAEVIRSATKKKLSASVIGEKILKQIIERLGYRVIQIQAAEKKWELA